MDEDCYEDLKEALLIKFDVSPEIYMQHFHSGIVPSGENPTQIFHRLKGLYQYWVHPEEHRKDEIGEIIVLVQLLCVLPVEVGI